MLNMNENQRKKFVLSQQSKHKNDVIDAALVSSSSAS